MLTLSAKQLDHVGWDFYPCCFCYQCCRWYGRCEVVYIRKYHPYIYRKLQPRHASFCIDMIFRRHFFWYCSLFSSLVQPDWRLLLDQVRAEFC